MTDHTRAMLEDAWKTLWPEPSDDIGTNAWLTWFNTLARFRKLLDAEAYLDAAVMLVPEGWAFACGSASPDIDQAWAWCEGPWEENPNPADIQAPTPALALLAAIMKAKNDE